MAQQGKSGSSKRRAPQRPQAHKTTPRLEPAARQILERALVIAEQYPTASRSQQKTVEKAVADLIQTHGVGICETICLDARSTRNQSRFTLLTTAIFNALSSQRKLQEAKQLLRRLKSSEATNVQIFGSMGIFACPEDKEQLLVWMREMTPRISDRAERYQAQFRIHLLSGNPQDYVPVRRCFKEYCRRAAELTKMEVLTLLTITSNSSDLDNWRRAVDAVSKVETEPVRVLGEQMYFRMLEFMDRGQLNALIKLIPDSPYVERIQLMAQQARMPEAEDG